MKEIGTAIFCPLAVTEFVFAVVLLATFVLDVAKRVNFTFLLLLLFFCTSPVLAAFFTLYYLRYFDNEIRFGLSRNLAQFDGVSLLARGPLCQIPSVLQ